MFTDTISSDIEVYIDGSYCRRKGQYGFVVVDKDKEIHAEAGRARPRQHGFPGRVRSNDCEVFAAIRALDWLAEHRPNVSTSIVTDSQTVATILSIRPSDPYVKHLQERIRAQPVEIRKVRAHKGVSHNEAADRIAKHGRIALPLQSSRLGTLAHQSE